MTILFVRYCVQGGNNAGHTVVVGDQHYYFEMLPSGIITEKCMNVIGEWVNIAALLVNVKITIILLVH